MKKKALAIALSLCMTAGLMAGCGSKPAENTAAEPSEQASEPQEGRDGSSGAGNGGGGYGKGACGVNLMGNKP